jgi:hypothetical protein
VGSDIIDGTASTRRVAVSAPAWNMALAALWVQILERGHVGMSVPPHRVR